MNHSNFTIWHNTKKDKEKSPDYIIRAKNENNEWIKIGAAWRKEVKGKTLPDGKPLTYLSCALDKPKENTSNEEIPF